MHTIHQVQGGWEVRKNGEPVEFFPLKYFEVPSDSKAYLDAVEYVREADGYGMYFDFTRITQRDNRVSRFC